MKDRRLLSRLGPLRFMKGQQLIKCQILGVFLLPNYSHTTSGIFGSHLFIYFGFPLFLPLNGKLSGLILILIAKHYI